MRPEQQALVRESWGRFEPAVRSAGAHQPAELVSEVAALGRRHAHYGVKDGDYESVGAALLWTLEQVLGEAFTPGMREAWSEAYLLVATVMRRAAAREHGVG
jgi:hemoglobin-like flavoprotein